MTSRMTRSKELWRKWRRPSRPSGAVVTWKPDCVSPSLAISRIDASSSTRSTRSSMSAKYRLHAERAADAGAPEAVPEDAPAVDANPQDARARRRLAVGAEDEVAEAPGDEAVAAGSLDRLEDVG